MVDVTREFPTPQASAAHLAAALGVSIRTARRFKAAGVMPFALGITWLVKGCGDLGAIAPEWRGWVIRDGQLWAPEGYGFRPGEVKAIPLRMQQLAHLQRELSEPRQLMLA